ncbi:MucR family transcriptional regulator [Allomesorhizobium camelthorni]|uniref:MucR family transcriptional regulator n=1 Tax=Allomesorhizobium camelthorni TaxID=475069 RepID=A0A6G4WKW5_9HYPH|nr:MucR family transcriptional regulator [Mesorhizobium camelthorni]
MTSAVIDDPIVELTADVVSAYVSNNPVPAAELAALIGQIHASLRALGSGAPVEVEEPQKPAVPIKKSVAPDHIVCLEDGKQFKSLKRHLMSQYGLTPDEYRAKWNLPADYPMVAPNYAATRSALAKKIGLGRISRKPVSQPARGRRKAAA